MNAAIYDLQVETGATFQLSMVWKDSLGAPINLSGYSAKMQFRTSPSDTTVVMEASTVAGTIVLGGSLGTISVTIPAATTGLISDTIQQLVYDLIVTSPGGVVTRLVQGKAYISPEVTR